MKDLLYTFDLRGYLVIPNVLSRRECVVLRRAIERRRENLEQNLLGQKVSGKMGMAAGLLQEGGDFLRLIDHPRVVEVLQSVISSRLRLEYVYGLIYDFGSPHLDMHVGEERDWSSFHYVVKNDIIHAGMCVVSYVLQDQDSSTGGFACVPGSHREQIGLSNSDRRRLFKIDSPLVETVEAKAGSAILFTERLWHGASAWRDKQNPRICLFYKYNDRACRHIHPDSCDQLEDFEHLLSDERRLFFGPPWVTGGPTVSGRNG